MRNRQELGRNTPRQTSRRNEAALRRLEDRDHLGGQLGPRDRDPVVVEGGAAERRFQRIAMSLGDGLVVADDTGRITLWNPGAAAIFGYQTAEMVGQHLDRICALEDGTGGRNAFAMIELSAGLQDSGGKIIELVGIVFAAERIRKKHPKRAVMFMAAANAAMAAVVAHNYSVK